MPFICSSRSPLARDKRMEKEVRGMDSGTLIYFSIASLVYLSILNLIFNHIESMDQASDHLDELVSRIQTTDRHIDT